MLRRILTPLLIALSALTLTLVGVAPATAAPAEQSQPLRQTVLRYDAGRAAEYTSAVTTAVRVWNSSVSNVRLEPAAAGQRAEIRIIADDGWPRAQPDGLGAGTVWMGRQAMDEGHDVLRVAAHELGHILGLPDRRTGVCGELMSGASAGTDCDNSTPNAAEIDEVEQNFAESEADRAPVASEVRASVY